MAGKAQNGGAAGSAAAAVPQNIVMQYIVRHCRSTVFLAFLFCGIHTLYSVSCNT